MGIERKNQEGYTDVTPFEALTNIEKESIDGFMPLVYIASPYRGDTEKNIVKARRYCRVAIDRKAIPLAPHLLYPQFMDDSNPHERRLALHKINYVLLGKCLELWVFGDEITSGMAHEITIAEKLGKRIRYFTRNGEEIR